MSQDGVFRRIASGALLGGLGFVSAALATFWATPQVVGGLGMEQYAVLGLLVGVQGGLLMVLSNPGQIAGLVVLAGPDDEGLHRRSRALSAWTLLAAVLAWAVGWALSLDGVAELLWKDELLQRAWSSAAPWAGLGWACQLVAQALWAGQRARLRAAQAEAQQALVSVLYVLAAPWAIYQAGGLEGVIEAQATVWVLAVALGLLWERRSDGRLALWPQDDPETFQQIRHLAFWSVLALLGSAVLLYADRLYSLKASPRELAAWSVATALSLRVAAGLGILGPLLLPSLSTVRQDPERATRLQSLYLRLTGLPALAFFVPLACGGASLLGAWVAPEVEERARPWIQLLAVSGFAFCLNGAYSTILTGIGKVRANAFISLASAVIGVTAGAIALWTGRPGAAWMGVAGQGLSLLFRHLLLKDARAVATKLQAPGSTLPRDRSSLWLLYVAVAVVGLQGSAFPHWFGDSLTRILCSFVSAGLLLFLGSLAVDAAFSAWSGKDSVLSQLRRLGSRGR